jgi:hypothetical protein
MWRSLQSFVEKNIEMFLDVGEQKKSRKKLVNLLKILYKICHTFIIKIKEKYVVISPILNL